MSRNFPTWDQTHWDYEKGNLDAATKHYAVEAARRVKARGGVDPLLRRSARRWSRRDVGWLQEIVAAGASRRQPHLRPRQRQGDAARRHPVPLPPRALADRGEDAARRSSPPTSAWPSGAEGADRHRAGRLPHAGRVSTTAWPIDRDLQADALEARAITWVSSKYPAHPIDELAKGNRSPEVIDGIVAGPDAGPAVRLSRGPDRGADEPDQRCRPRSAPAAGRWPSFLEAIRRPWPGRSTTGGFDFLGHPSCLYVADPEFQTIDLICDLVKKAGKKAALVDLGTIAERGRLRKK